MFRLQKKLKYIKQKLKKWNIEVFGNIDRGKKPIEGIMEELHEQCIQEGYIEERRK